MSSFHHRDRQSLSRLIVVELIVVELLGDAPRESSCFLTTFFRLVCFYLQRCKVSPISQMREKNPMDNKGPAQPPQSRYSSAVRCR